MTLKLKIDFVSPVQGITGVPAVQQSQSGGCPIVGDYTGTIPGAIGLCARIASDCNNPDIMFYTVYNCENSTHIYEGKCAKRARSYALAGAATRLPLFSPRFLSRPGRT